MTRLAGKEQSTVVRHIKRVQEHFGGGLFESGGSGPLSTRGAIVEQAFRTTMVELSRTRDRLAERPVLRIGFIRPMRVLVQRALCERSNARGASFEVSLVELTTERQARALARRELDIAICYALPEIAERSGVEESVVTEEPIALVIPERAWVRGKPALEVLSQLTYASLPRLPTRAVTRASDKWLADHELTPKRQVECALGSEVLAYAGSGYGYGFLPALWSMGDHDDVVFAPIDGGATAKIAAYSLAHVTPMVTHLRDDLSAAARAALKSIRAK